jgi:hypothetical protein
MVMRTRTGERFDPDLTNQPKALEWNEDWC